MEHIDRNLILNLINERCKVRLPGRQNMLKNLRNNGQGISQEIGGMKKVFQTEHVYRPQRREQLNQIANK